MSISSIIITYQPDISILSSLLLNNSATFNQVIVVDNGSLNVADIREVTNKSNKIKLIELGDNLGIATAQNIGIKNLNVDDEELIVFFDQDSSIDIDFLSLLESEYFNIESKYNQPIILGPTFYHRYKNFEYPIIRFNKYGLRDKMYASKYKKEVEASCIISSGMCVRKSVIDYVGYMKDELFIDYVDTEWCMRAVSLGCKVFVSPKLIMKHEIGYENINVLKWRVPVHAGKRRYYRIRNSFWLWKYKCFPKLTVIREISFSIFHQIILICLVKNRKEQFENLLMGIKDGVYYKREV